MMTWSLGFFAMDQSGVCVLLGYLPVTHGCSQVNELRPNSFQQLDLPYKLTVELCGEERPMIQGAPVRLYLGTQGLRHRECIRCGFTRTGHW